MSNFYDLDKGNMNLGQSGSNNELPNDSDDLSVLGVINAGVSESTEFRSSADSVRSQSDEEFNWNAEHVEVYEKAIKSNLEKLNLKPEWSNEILSMSDFVTNLFDSEEKLKKEINIWSGGSVNDFYHSDWLSSDILPGVLNKIDSLLFIDVTSKMQDNWSFINMEELSSVIAFSLFEKLNPSIVGSTSSDEVRYSSMFLSNVDLKKGEWLACRDVVDMAIGMMLIGAARVYYLENMLHNINSFVGHMEGSKFIANRKFGMASLGIEDESSRELELLFSSDPSELADHEDAFMNRFAGKFNDYCENIPDISNNMDTMIEAASLAFNSFVSEEKFHDDARVMRWFMMSLVGAVIKFMGDSEVECEEFADNIDEYKVSVVSEFNMSCHDMMNTVSRYSPDILDEVVNNNYIIWVLSEEIIAFFAAALLHMKKDLDQEGLHSLYNEYCNKIQGFMDSVIHFSKRH